jgi:LytS/YehU family sensor histidine kinase
MAALQSQIQSHFLYNTLETITGLVDDYIRLPADAAGKRA